MLAVRFHDKKEICFSFIIHTMEEVAFGKSDVSGRSVKILRLIHDYNKHMGGVDKNDVLVGNNSCARKSQKWTRKVFFLFIEEAVLFILQRKRGSNKCFLQFKLNLIRSILRETHIDFDITEAGKIKYVGRHYIEWINPTENKDKPQERCVVCTKDGRRRDSRYNCKVSANYPGLCSAPCFGKYH